MIIARDMPWAGIYARAKRLHETLTLFHSVVGPSPSQLNAAILDLDWLLDALPENLNGYVGPGSLLGPLGRMINIVDQVYVAWSIDDPLEDGRQPCGLPENLSIGLAHAVKMIGRYVDESSDP